MNRVAKRGAPRSPQGRAEPRPAPDDADREDRLILSYTLLLSLLVSALVISLGHAEANPTLAATFFSYLN
jgi:hypothetical protein